MGGWCPWCGARLEAVPGDARCPACHGKLAEGSLLSAPPPAPLKPGDPDARVPARGPETSQPLPPGAPVPTTEGMLRWVATILFGIVLVALLARFVGAPALSHVTPRPPAPTPTGVETPAPTAPPAASPPRR